MCLSTVYQNERIPENIVMKNVMRMECRNGKLIFTDLMDRKLEVDAQLDSCDLSDSWILIRGKDHQSERKNQDD